MLAARFLPRTCVAWLLLAGCVLLPAGCRRSMVNTAPEPPAIGGPGRGGLDTAYSFGVIASDADGDSVSVRLAWGDGDTSDWSNWVANGEGVLLTHAWRAFDTYRLRAQARDAHDSLSAWGPLSGRELLIDPVRWSFACDDPGGTGRLSVAPDRTVYFASVYRFLYALGPDGTEQWCVRAGGSVPSVGTDGRVYSLSDGLLYALNPDGTLAWSDSVEGLPYRGERCQTAIGTDGSVYVGDHHYLLAYWPDGRRRWRCPLDSTDCRANPVVGPDGTIYTGSELWYYAVRPDGTEQWRCPLRAEVSTAAFGPDGTIYVSQNDVLHAVSPAGVLKWSVPVAAPGVAVGSDGTIYSCERGQLVLRNQDGSVRSIYPVYGEARGVPALAADGTVYVATRFGTLYAIDEAGAIRWQYDVGSEICSDAVLGQDGVVHVQTHTGAGIRVYSINVPSALADAPWPMYLHDPQHTGRAGP